MKDEILRAADDIALIFNETTEWLDPKRAAIVKILKKLNSRNPKAKNIKSKEEKSNERLLKFLILYFELSLEAFWQERRGQTPDWAKVLSIVDKIKDNFDIDSIKESL
jgi:hypothetical protein